MPNLLRILLIWLLVLAVPAQGVAAATMLYCGPDHHGTRSDSMHDGSHGAAMSAHHHASDAEPRHHDHAMHDHAAHGVKNTGSADAQAEVSVVTVAGVPDSSPEVKCSVCATCCNAAAIASSVITTSSNRASPAPAPSVVAAPVSFITDGPRRPPRPFLA